jgi:hypothetical protein
MNRYRSVVTIAVALALLLIYSPAATAAELVKAKDGSGIIGYNGTPIPPCCGTSGTTTHAGRAILP